MIRGCELHPGSGGTSCGPGIFTFSHSILRPTLRGGDCSSQLDTRAAKLTKGPKSGDRFGFGFRDPDVADGTCRLPSFGRRSLSSLWISQRQATSSRVALGQKISHGGDME